MYIYIYINSISHNKKLIFFSTKDIRILLSSKSNVKNKNKTKQKRKQKLTPPLKILIFFVNYQILQH